jgi:aryl-alcohol dehydrogenase-like predicted oxidoreductase
LDAVQGDARMQYTTLGRTGLSVSVAGLGCGGHSRLGLATGHDDAHARNIVAAALDLGINFIDTARAYGTERAVGAAIHGRRSSVVISTKASPTTAKGRISAAELRDSVEGSLTRLGTDYIDVMHLHGVLAEDYEYCVTELLPELQRLRTAGKIRFLGITERFGTDTRHEMLMRALPDDHFEVVMIGFNLLNPSARQRAFPMTQQNRVGTLVMFAVRRALTSPEGARRVVDALVEAGAVDGAALDRDNPLGFVERHPEVASLVQAAYRYCRYEPGAEVILTGTGSVDHLRENVASILAPPLPAELTARLTALFERVDSVSGD